MDMFMVGVFGFAMVGSFGCDDLLYREAAVKSNGKTLPRCFFRGLVWSDRIAGAPY